MQWWYGSKAIIGWVVGAVVFLPTGYALADSYMNYTLEIGGNNHADVWHAGTAPCFSFSGSATPQATKNCTTNSAGTASDEQSYPVGTVITYAVILEVGGVHNQPGHDSDGDSVYGAANTVFNLAIYKDIVDPENPYTGADFFSTIHDGEGTDPVTGAANITASAAFAHSYQILGGCDPGRAKDSYLNCGSYAAPAYSYPSDEDDGKLIGMGFGYHKWQRTGTAEVTTPGIGLVTLPGKAVGSGLGIVPIAEGQIDTTGLALGTYILEVTPGIHNNVLRGDLDLFSTVDREVFAVAANSTNGDTIEFTICDPNDPDCGGPEISEWRSVRTHGACGDLAIVLDGAATGASASVEPREGGIQKIEVDFDKAVSSISGTIQAVGTSSTVNATGANLINGGLTLEILFSGGLPDADCYTIDLSSHIVGLEGDADVTLLALPGEVEFDGQVGLGDALEINANNGRPVCTDSQYVRFDIDTNGAITLGDALIVNYMYNGYTASCP